MVGGGGACSTWPLLHEDGRPKDGRPKDGREMADRWLQLDHDVGWALKKPCGSDDAETGVKVVKTRMFSSKKTPEINKTAAGSARKPVSLGKWS